MADNGLCEVRSATDLACGRSATTTILGIRFCERCAREQEVYFAVGELTQIPKRGRHGQIGGKHAARMRLPEFPAGLRRHSPLRSADRRPI